MTFCTRDSSMIITLTCSNAFLLGNMHAVALNDTSVVKEKSERPPGSQNGSNLHPKTHQTPKSAHSTGTCTWNQNTCSCRIKRGHGHEAKTHLWSLSSWSSRILFSQRWQHLNISSTHKIPLDLHKCSTCGSVKTSENICQSNSSVAISCTLHFTLMIHEFIGGLAQIRQERPYNTYTHSHTANLQLTSLLSDTRDTLASLIFVLWCTENYHWQKGESFVAFWKMWIYVICISGGVWSMKLTYIPIYHIASVFYVCLLDSRKLI